ncbi:MAG: hypothetical protein HY063_02565 [Bacteroidetes bacterium]|nr:hypothetical protein [Bacteroidota bacterium]
MKATIVLLFLFFSFSCFAQNKIVFEKKKNPTRTYEIQTPAACDIIFINGKINGYVSDIKDSFLVVRIFNPGKIDNAKEKIAEAKKIMKDKSLTKRERENEVVKYLYRDSLKLPLSSVTRMKFFSAQKRSKYFLVYAASFILAAGLTELTINLLPTRSDNRNATDVLIVLVEFSAIMAVDYSMFVKRINPHKWQVRK